MQRIFEHGAVAARARTGNPSPITNRYHPAGTWFAYVGVTSSLVLATRYHRALVERDRQAKLAASKLRYRAIAELSYDYAYALVIEADGKVRCDWVTEAFTRITGYHWMKCFRIGYGVKLHEAVKYMSDLLPSQQGLADTTVY